MISKTTGWILTGLLVMTLFGAGMGFLALSHFSENPAEILFQGWDRARVPLQEGGTVLIVEQAPPSSLSVGRERRLILEKAGQPVMDTPLYAGDGQDTNISIYFYPEYGVEGPFLRLAEPRGEFLVDVGTHLAARILRGPGGPTLASVAGDARVGVIIAEDGGLTHVEGVPIYGAPAREDGVLIGRILTNAEGRLVYRARP